MKSFLKFIETELNRSINNLACQDFKSAVDSIALIREQVQNVLKRDVMFLFPEEMTKKDIIKKYPSIDFNAIIAKEDEEYFQLGIGKRGYIVDRVNNTDVLFTVRQGFDINTGKIVRLKMSCVELFGDNDIRFDIDQDGEGK